MKIKKLVIRNNENTILLQLLLSFVLIIPACVVLTRMGISDANKAFFSLVFIGFGTIFLVLQSAKLGLKPLQLWIFFGGYVARLLVELIDIYAANYVTILHSGDDSLGFYNAAVQLYNTGTAERISKYAETINGIFQCFGENRLLAQYSNVLCYVGTMILIIKTCRRFRVKEQYQTWIMAFLAFMPNYICLSSILLRESLMIFLDALAVYFMVCWMDEGKLEHLVLAFIAPIPAIVLHSASIGVWIGCFMICAVWDGKKKKIRITMWTGLLAVLAVVLLIVVSAVPALRNLLLVYFPEEISIQSITGRYFVPGGSDYLMNLQVNNWGEFAFWTVIRMIYFVFSPMPTDWRGLQDMAAFAIDSVPIFVFMVGMCNGIRKRKDVSIMLLPLLVCFTVVGIFAWGTSNAGTAMRHRGLLIGVFAIAYCISKSSRNYGKQQEDNIRKH